jgi:hypothetical protein
VVVRWTLTVSPAAWAGALSEAAPMTAAASNAVFLMRGSCYTGDR